MFNNENQKFNYKILILLIIFLLALALVTIIYFFINNSNNQAAPANNEAAVSATEDGLSGDEELELLMQAIEEASQPPLDTDGDGLADEEESAWGSDPNNKDVDGDGLTDSEEVNLYYTRFDLADSDSDGYSDYEEVKSGHDPLVAGSNE